MCSCAEVWELIELFFGMVSGVGPGTDVWNGGPRGSRRRGRFGVLCLCWPSGFNGLIFNRDVFDSCVKS